MWGTGYKKADLALQFVRWCVHKLAVIPARVGSIGSHPLHSLGVVASYKSLCTLQIGKIYATCMGTLPNYF